MRMKLLGLAFIGLLGLSACGGDSGSTTTSYPAVGRLELTVLDGDTASPLSAARVTVIDGETGSPLEILTTGLDGKVSTVCTTGTLQLKVSAQDYAPSPAPGIPPLPVQILANQTTAITVNLYPLPLAERGTISGWVSNGFGQAVSGALVVANASDGSYVSTVAGTDGSYILFNVPVGSTTVDTYRGGFNFTSSAAISVSADTNSILNIAAESFASGGISGHVSFTSISGGIIDITLLHPGTREVLPGLRAYTDNSGSYLMVGVPNGSFEIMASLDNDGYVLDPDTSVTQGVPQVTINNNAVTKDFKVTGSIELTNPATSFDGSVPVLDSVPLFTWLKDSSYASAEDYVVEVVDESGNTVWGGFDALNNFTPLVIVPQNNNPSISYDSDGTATVSPLEAGRYYQLRVYARVNDGSLPTGYTLLSASETLDGIFKVAATAP